MSDSSDIALGASRESEQERYPDGAMSARSRRHMREFHHAEYEWRRLFAETLGTFMLVFVAAGGGVVNARFGGNVIPTSAQVVAPGMVVMAVILFMGMISGAHLNPGVSLAFALRGDFPWRRVPGYLVAQILGSVLASLLLVSLMGKQGAAGLTLPGQGVDWLTATIWEAVLTAGLVSVILGTAWGAQTVGWGASIAVGGYIALAGLIGSPVTGASMNTARSLGPALVFGDMTAWWTYVLGPLIGALMAVGIAQILHGRGGDPAARRTASGTLD